MGYQCARSWLTEDGARWLGESTTFGVKQGITNRGLYLLQSLAAAARNSPALIAEEVFASEISLPLICFRQRSWESLSRATSSWPEIA